MKYLVAGFGSLCLLAASCSGADKSPLESNAGIAGFAGYPSAAAGAGGSSGGSTTKACTVSDCASGICSADQCKDVTCVKGTTVCIGHYVNVCGADGALQGVAENCGAGNYCLEKGGTAFCSPTVCFPGDSMCVGNVATTCAPDGSGPKAGGSDCAKQACYQGECRDLLCTPGQRLCDNGSLFLCAENGTSRALVATCGAAFVCDAKQSACVPKVCDPGKMACDSTRLTTCNAAGSAWVQTGTDCAAQGAVCVAGSCIAKACSPNSRFCSGNNVYSCSSDSTMKSLYQRCAGSQQCVESDGSAFCSTPECVPGQTTCNGDVLATCNADGSDWLPGGIDCSLTGTSCIAGRCQATVCTPGELFCKDGNVQRCADGLSSSQIQFCAQGTYCLKNGSTTDCAPTPCQPDTDGCAAEKLGHCAADGKSVVVSADCGSQSKVCTLAGCASVAVDTVSSVTEIGTAGGGEMIGNFILVHSARKLTAIEADISMPQPRTLIWAVYESTNADQNGEFDLKFQKSTAGSGTGFQSSGAVSVQLEAGKSYYIGVSASDGSFAYYYGNVTVAPSINFAHVIGSYDTSFAPSFDYPNQSISTAFHQRLTTTLP